MATPVAPPPAPAPAGPKFTWGGLVDTYYLFNFVRPDGANTLTGPVGRAFDTNANSASLALAKLSLNASMDMVSFQMDFGYGGDGAIINGATSPGAPVAPAFVLEQAFGTITLPIGLPSFSLDFGKFVTTAGAEVIEANKNWLYSRSFLFNAIPILHTGVRANLKINDQVSLQAGLVNGWNNDPDNNSWKTGEVSATITASPMVSIIATTYFGKEAAQGTPDPDNAFRFLGDLVAALTLSDKFGLNFNFDYIKAYDNVAGDYLVGAALMGRYVISDHLNVAARGEFIDTSTGGVSSKAEEGTVMLGIDVGKNFELRPELRGDFSGDPIFNTKKNQFTGTLAALTWF